jgi:hypothetical protein
MPSRETGDPPLDSSGPEYPVFKPLEPTIDIFMENTTTARTTTGQFTKGNNFAKGHGSPFASSVIELKKAMMTACTPERIKAATDRLFDLCTDEDKRVSLQALDLLFSRLFGKPTTAIEVTEMPSGGINPSLLSDDQLSNILSILDGQKPV